MLRIVVVVLFVGNQTISYKQSFFFFFFRGGGRVFLFFGGFFLIFIMNFSNVLLESHN